MTDQQDMKDGILPEDREGQIEDFEMQAKSSEEEVKSDFSDEIIEVDKMEDLAEETEEDKENCEESSENESQVSKIDENDEKERKNEEKVEFEEEEEKKLDQFKSRDRINYENEAYGNENLTSNTEKMKDGQEGGDRQGSQDNIISKMKKE